MLEIHTTLTNEEAQSLDETIRTVDATFVKRMSTADAKPRDLTALAWVAFHKITQPVRDHLRKLRGPRE